MIDDQLLSAFIKEPFSASARVVSNASVFKTSCRVSLNLRQAVRMRKLGNYYVFANGTNLRRCFGSLSSGSMRGYFTVFTANGTNMIMSRGIGVPNCIKVVTHCIAVICIKSITASKTSLFSITSFLAGGGNYTRSIIVVKLRKRDSIFAIAVNTAVGRVSAVLTRGINLSLKCVVVSRRSNYGCVVEITARALVLCFTV